MSAYIVSEATMARVVGAIATPEEREGGGVFTASAVALAKAVLAGDVGAALALADEVVEHGAAPDPYAGLTKLGRDLYAMNQAAVIARYGDRPDDDYQAVPAFRFTPGLAEAGGGRRGWAAGGECPALTAVAELVYQCGEGDVPTWPLFERLLRAETRLRAEWEAGAADRAKAAAEAEAARRAAERPALLAENPHLLTKADRPTWGGYRLAAENIRRELKRRFPKVKFKVTSDSYSGGNSVDVRWTDGPTAKDVEAVADRHKGGSFNGMEDIYEYDRGNVFGDLFGTAKYVFCQRESTVAAVRAANPGEEIPEDWQQDNDSSRVYWIRKKWAETAF